MSSAHVIPINISMEIFIEVLKRLFIISGLIFFTLGVVVGAWFF